MPIIKATTPRRAPSRRTRTPAETVQPIATPEPESYASGTLLSREEKRQIILAHASARRPTDPVQVTSMWVGVAACIVVVAIGWWWAVKPEIVGKLSQGLPPALAESRQVASEVVDSLSGLTKQDALKPLSEGAGKQLEVIKQQAAIESAAKKEIANTLAGQPAASATRDLFNPGLVVTGTPALQTEKISEISKP